MARICNSMYSFHRLFYAGKMTATEFPSICASLGIREIEPLDRWIPSDDAGLSRFEAAIKEANCAVAQLTCGIGLFAADEAKRREKVEEAKKWARIAHRLGAPAMRIRGIYLTQPSPRDCGLLNESNGAGSTCTACWAKR